MSTANELNVANRLANSHVRFKYYSLDFLQRWQKLCSSEKRLVGLYKGLSNPNVPHYFSDLQTTNILRRWCNLTVVGSNKTWCLDLLLNLSQMFGLQSLTLSGNSVTRLYHFLYSSCKSGPKVGQRKKGCDILKKYEVKHALNYIMCQ